MRALVRGLPPSFVHAICSESPVEPIDLKKAQQQRHAYVELLRSVVQDVIEVPADGRHPGEGGQWGERENKSACGCCVLDLLLHCQTVSVVSHQQIAPLWRTRQLWWDGRRSLRGLARLRGWARRYRSQRRCEQFQGAKLLCSTACCALKPASVDARLTRHCRAQLGLDIRRLEAPATLDGGDVLQLPASNVVLVGLSKRTNAAGVEQLQAHLPGCSVVGVLVRTGEVTQRGELTATAKLRLVALPLVAALYARWTEACTLSRWSQRWMPPRCCWPTPRQGVVWAPGWQRCPRRRAVSKSSCRTACVPTCFSQASAT